MVADGGSTDGTVEAAEQAGALVVTGATGRGAQLAAGVAACDSPVVLLIHADAVLAPGSMAAALDLLGQDQVKAVAFKQRIDGDRPLYRRLERWADRRCERGMVFGDSGLCLEREVLAAAGGVPPEPLFEDVLLSRALARLPGHVALAQGPIVISGRRWERRGAVRVTLENKALQTAFALGVPSGRLAALYRRGS